MRTRGGNRGEDGQVVPLVAVLLVVVAVMGLLVAHVGSVLDERARATTAADAAALAGAVGGWGAAAEVAGRNGGTLEELVQIDGTTTAVVRVGRARATASAEASPVDPPATWRPPG